MKPVFKKLMISGVFILSAVFGKAQKGDTAISFFNGTFKEAVKKAKEENKHIFLDAYASWCGPCKTMEKEVFTNREVIKYFNANFVSIRVDMEKGEGPDLAKRLTSIDGYPSLLFFSPGGNLSKTILGSRIAKVFLAEAKLVVK